MAVTEREVVAEDYQENGKEAGCSGRRGDGWYQHTHPRDYGGRIDDDGGPHLRAGSSVNTGGGGNREWEGEGERSRHTENCRTRHHGSSLWASL